MRLLVMLFLASLFALSPLLAAEVTREIPGSNAKPSFMPAERAKAMFEDGSVRAFMSAVAKDFGGKCSIPDHTKTEAVITQRGSGDFSSTFYEVTIPCPGDNGLTVVVITAEFSPPLGTPLDLILSLRYRR
ncbi:MAG: hypothetical protein GXX82_02985 [Syntrophorhabdus sp.]|jgi:hypothetical protein|nr:hypothetical protein [Syntrophorhabdus sp.]